VTVDTPNKGSYSSEDKRMLICTSLIYYVHKTCATYFDLRIGHHPASYKNSKPSCLLNWLSQYGFILYNVIIKYLDRITAGFIVVLKHTRI
jgi:hypothetical protein